MVYEGSGDVLIVPPRTGYAEERRISSSVFRASDGSEERETLLLGEGDGAVRLVNIQVSALGIDEAHYVDNVLKHAQEGTLYVPLWFSLSHINGVGIVGARVYCETVLREFQVGGQVLIMTPDLSKWEYRTITAIDETYLDVSVAFSAGYQSGDLVLPLIEATPLGGSSGKWRIDHYRTADLRLEEVTGGAQGEYYLAEVEDEYLDLPVFGLLPDEQTESQEKERDLQGDDWGYREAYSQERVERVISMQILLRRLEDRRRLQEFFDSRQGKILSFWVRSLKSDLSLYASAGASATTIRIRRSGENVGLVNISRHFYSRALKSFHKIESVATSTDYHELTIAPGLSGALPAGSRLENLYYCRFDQDVLRLDYAGLGEGVCTAQVRVRELQRETP